MFSWQLWSLLDIVPVNQPILKTLSTKSSNAPLPAILAPFIIGAVCICIVAPFICIPLGLALFCLRCSLRIAGEIAKQHEVGNYTLLAITPVGALGMALSISRRYSSGIRANFREGKAFITALGVAVVLFNLVSVVSVMMSPPRNPTNLIETLTPMLLAALVVFAIAQEYIQSTILGVVVGMFAGSMGERNTARVAAIACYLGIQLAFYILLVLLLIVAIRFGVSLGFANQSLDLILNGLFCALIYFGVREITIFALWRQVLLRFNDDVPTFDGKVKRG